ncbi:MAG: hypothetical protein ACLGXA_07155 [Acidobacteriota bacterium]
MNAEATAQTIPNGAGAAALLAAGIGCFTLAVLAIVGDKVPGIGRAMVFYRPTGPLSGVTTTAVLVWLLVWAVLDRRWKKKTVAISRVSASALVLLALALLLTFPPLADLF